MVQSWILAESDVVEKGSFANPTLRMYYLPKIFSTCVMQTHTTLLHTKMVLWHDYEYGC